MTPLVWLLLLVGLAAIIASLGFGLYHLARGRAEDSGKLARALTIRIGISVLLFLLLMLAWHLGLIAPHGLEGGPRR